MRRAVVQKIQGAPVQPGVYIFRGARNRPLYIGKAQDLRSRLRYYLAPAGDPRLDQLARRARDLDYIVTASDIDALVLEDSLVKLNKPRYNVRLKDDKKYPYLKVTVGEEFPRVFFTRDLKPDGAVLFGPYTSAKAVRRVLRVVTRVFRLRTCDKDLTRTSTARACLEFQMGRCLAPCRGIADRVAYQTQVARLIDFLSGRTAAVEQALETAMGEAAAAEDFERAAEVRDQLLALRELARHQPVATAESRSLDVVNLARGAGRALVCLIRVREGRFSGKETYPFTVPAAASDEEVLAAVLRTIHTHTQDLPDEIILPVPIPDAEIVEHWARNKRGRVLLVRLAEDAFEERMVELAGRNAEVALAAVMPRPRTPLVVVELRDRLSLPALPAHIEGVDISNTAGRQATGSVVVFRNGRPDRSAYRRFRIRTVPGPDDFAMIREVLVRRFARIKKEGGHLPDLVLVDGGKGQLSAALAARDQVGTPVTVFAFAKRPDRLYAADGREVWVPASSPALRLLTQVRSEAHRFAITFHRRLRARQTRSSALDVLPGIGPKRQLALIRYFGSVTRLRRATVDEIARVPGFGRTWAERIHSLFHHD